MAKGKVFPVDVRETTATGIWKSLEQGEKSSMLHRGSRMEQAWVGSESKKEEECERVERKESQERERKDKRSQES